MKRTKRWMIVAVCLLASAWPAMAASDAEMAALKSQLKQLQSRLDHLEHSAATNNAVRTTETKALIKEMMADANNRPAAPSWLDRLKFYADLRLRYQFDRKNKTNGAADQGVRNRARFRVRFGFTKTWEDWEVGFRLATGSDENPESPNQTFDDSFSKKKIWIDLAYAKWTPKSAPGFTFIGGKMKTPISSRTRMTWHSDITPEGLFAQYKTTVAEGVKAFGEVGYFILAEENDSKNEALDDATLLTLGGGAEFNLGNKNSLMVAGTWYEFNNLASNGKFTPNIPAGGFAKNNWDYRNLELTARYKTHLGSRSLSFHGSWLHNFANSDFQGRDGGCDAFLVGGKLGSNKKKGDWSVGYQYCYMGEYAAPSWTYGSNVVALADSDVGPNRKGHIFNAKYNIEDYLTIGATVFVTDPIRDNDDDCEVTAKFDVIWKF